MKQFPDEARLSCMHFELSRLSGQQRDKRLQMTSLSSLSAKLLQWPRALEFKPQTQSQSEAALPSRTICAKQSAPDNQQRSLPIKSTLSDVAFDLKATSCHFYHVAAVPDILGSQLREAILDAEPTGFGTCEFLMKRLNRAVLPLGQ